MKKTILSAAAICLAVLMYMGCDQQRGGTGGVSVSDGGRVAASAARAPEGGLKLPVGTEFRNVKKDGIESVSFVLPQGFFVAGRKSDGSTVLIEEGEIRCKCLRGGGTCSPFRACQGRNCTVGCVLNGCSECHSAVSLVGGEELSEVAVLDLRSEYTSVVLTHEEAMALSCPTAAALERPEVQAVLARYAAETYEDELASAVKASATIEDLPDAYTLAPVNVAGMLLWLPRPREGGGIAMLLSDLMRERYDEDGRDRVAKTMEEGGGGSCRCAEGTGTCTHKRQRIPGIGSAEWCESGGCASCALRY